MTDLADPTFHDEEAARAHLESLRWPNGPFCPHCGSIEGIRRLDGKSHRAGLHQCNASTGHFTVTVGTVMERSHVALHKWVLGFHLLSASKKGMSAHQLSRMLDVTYKTAWIMGHRIREAMRPADDETPSPIGGSNKVVEVDEMYIGGKDKNRHANKGFGIRGGAAKEAVVSLEHLPLTPGHNLRR